jgi:hypothetical protein
MPLVARVQARYSNQRLTELTNAEDRNANTPSTEVLDAAASDIEAAFEVYAGVTYSDTTATHVLVAVEGVEALLIRRAGNNTLAEARWNLWLDSLRALSRVEGRERIMPDSNTKLEPSEDDRLSSTPRPAFDDRRFDPFLPNTPRGGVLDDWGV